jgi:hypothetical protein
MQDKDEYIDLAKQQLLDAIYYYVDRQKLVAQAVTELGIDKTLLTPEKILQWSELRAKIPTSGSWTDEDGGKWIYFLHGYGCRLTNLKTDESIDWNMKRKINAFDPYFFYKNLVWQISVSARDNKVLQLKGWEKEEIINLIDILIEEGKINQDWSIPDKENK